MSDLCHTPIGDLSGDHARWYYDPIYLSHYIGAVWQPFLSGMCRGILRQTNFAETISELTSIGCIYDIAESIEVFLLEKWERWDEVAVDVTDTTITYDDILFYRYTNAAVPTVLGLSDMIVSDVD